MEELEAEGGVGGREGAEEEGADGLRKTKREKRQREVCVSAQVVSSVCGCCAIEVAARARVRACTCRKTSLDRQSIDSTFGANTLPTFAAIADRLRSSLLLLLLLRPVPLFGGCCCCVEGLRSSSAISANAHAAHRTASGFVERINE